MKALKTIALAGILCSTLACKGETGKPSTIKIASVEQINEHPEPAETASVIQVAVLLDTSNSMDGLINQAKAQLWSIVTEMSYAKCNETRPKLQIALYEYGNSSIEQADNYVRQVLDFTTDLDVLSERLFSLTTGGGQEYCGAVIDTSLKRLQWSKASSDLKMIFIAGNEPFTQGPVDYKNSAAFAVDKDVSVNTIFCGNAQQGVHTRWKDGADLTKGSYTNIDSNQKTLYVATPYDDKIMQLNNRLNSTYMYYGSQGRQKYAAQAAMDVQANELEETVAVKRAVAKTTHNYSNSSWDLIDASKEESFDLDEIKSSQLPAEYQGLSKKQIETKIKEKAAERVLIQKEIAQLNTQRETYVRDHTDKQNNGLESAMIQAIKTQGAKKNISFKKQ